MKKRKIIVWLSMILFSLCLFGFLQSKTYAKARPEPAPKYLKPGKYPINPPIYLGNNCDSGYYDVAWVDFRLPGKAIYRGVRFFISVYWTDTPQTLRIHNKYNQILYDGYTSNLYGWSSFISTDVARLWIYPCGHDYGWVRFDSLELKDTDTALDDMRKPSVSEFRFELLGNFPNPFNAETRIEYTVAKDGIVVLSIYNLLGQRIRSLIDEYQTAGSKVVYWNGKNDQGEEVSSGIYFYNLKAGDFPQTRKMVMMK